jgi:hypothetical protein
MLVLPSMHRDFEINDGIYLCQPPHKLDLHNNFDFCSLNYSIEERFSSCTGGAPTACGFLSAHRPS